LKNELSTPLVVSFKANSNPDLFVRCSGAFVDGIELASLGELNVVVGRSAAPKFINTPALERNLIAAGIASRATLVLDSPAQLEMLAMARGQFASAAIALRLNVAGLIGDVPGAAGADHFGFDLQDAHAAAVRLRDLGLGVRGLHAFGGSYSFKTCSVPIRAAIERVLPGIQQAAGAPIEFVNLGGGFSEDWDRQPGALHEYRRSLAQLSAKVRVIHEAGRAVFARAGCFVVEIIAVKSVAGRRVAVCDGGITHCFQLAQTEKVMKKFRRPHHVRMGGAVAGTGAGKVQIVGNSCNRMDIIGELEAGTVLAPGDRLIFSDCGAYTTYSPTGFLNLKAARRYLLS
jgi:diaminopimelate decarboxylase